MDSQILKRYFDIDTEKVSGNGKLLHIRNWRILKAEFPTLIISMRHPKSGIEYCFSFLCDDFPLSVSVVDPVNFLPVLFEKWPQGGFFLNGHSRSHGPFLCAPGIREYHNHSSHEGETQWVFTSASFRLTSILDTVYTHLMRSNS